MPLLETDSAKMGELMERYTTLRAQLKDLSVSELEGSDDYRELIQLQDRLVVFVTDAPEFRGLSEHTGIVAEIRNIIRPPRTEAGESPFIQCWQGREIHEQPTTCSVGKNKIILLKPHNVYKSEHR